MGTVFAEFDSSLVALALGLAMFADVGFRAAARTATAHAHG
jgi:hypothetical protein